MSNKKKSFTECQARNITKFGTLTLYTPYAIDHYSLFDHKRLFPDHQPKKRSARSDNVVASHIINLLIGATSNESLKNETVDAVTVTCNELNRISQLTLANTKKTIAELELIKKKSKKECFSNLGFLVGFEFNVTGDSPIHINMNEAVRIIDYGFKLIHAIHKHSLIPKEEISEFKAVLGKPLRKFHHSVHKKSSYLRKQHQDLEPLFHTGNAH